MKRPVNVRQIAIIFLIYACGAHFADADDQAGESKRVFGRATFTDGRAVANSLMRFNLTTGKPTGEKARRPRPKHQVDCTTTVDGSFEITLPAPKQYSARIMAYENGEAGDRKWWLDLPVIKSDLKPLKLVFDDRGRILVAINYEAKLPGGYLPEIICRSTAYGPKTAFSHKPQTNSGGISLNNLQPGEYELTLAISNVGQRWKYTVKIPNEKPFMAKTRITVPRLKFGDIKAKFLMPDGVTPASEIRFYLHCAGRGRGVKTDENGDLNIKQVLQGGFGLVPKQARGIANVRVPGKHKIEDGKVTDLGIVRLPHVDEVLGHFEGTVRYNDGTPVDPIYLTHTSFDTVFSGMMGAYKLPVSHPERFEEPERFRVQLEQGIQHVVFKFERPPGGLPQAFNFGDAHDGRKQLIADIKIAPGKTLKRDLILTRRKKGDQITVTHNMRSEQPCTLTAVVDLKGLRCFNSTYVSSNPQRQTFKQVPAGACHIVLSSFECFMIKTIPEKSDTQSVHFDTSQTGGVQVQVTDPTGKPLKGLGLRISRDVGKTQFVACSVLPASELPREKVLKHLKMFRESAEGKMTVTGLGPGQYLVAIKNGERTHQRSVQIKRSTLSKLLIQVQATGEVQNESQN